MSHSNKQKIKCMPCRCFIINNCLSKNEFLCTVHIIVPNNKPKVENIVENQIPNIIPMAWIIL